ncbi:hypothetical protein [Janibacter sp. GXQ6167]|uniref:hypothetical protein n=1 Tax=Janibacter sp. GXQ6167 TaxID=3240791 RepID=UPI003526BC47
MNDATRQLGDSIRSAVIKRLDENPESIDELADGLNVSSGAVHRMMEAPRWDLSLALSAADHLRMRLHVSAS